MADPENNGVNGRENIDYKLEEPKKAGTAGLSNDEIGMNALSQAELTDPTRPENFIGAPSAQEVKNEVDSTTSGYDSGHDSFAAQKEQYDAAMSGAAKGRISGTLFDIICEEKKYIEEQKKRVLQYAAMTSLSDLIQAANELGKQYDTTAQEFAELGVKVADIEQVFNEQISDIYKELEKQQQRIEDLKTRMENGEMSQSMMVEWDTNKEKIEVLNNLRDALQEEKKALVKSFTKSKSLFKEAHAKHESLEQQLKDAQKTGDTDKIKELQQKLTESSDDLTQAKMKLAHVYAHIESAEHSRGQMLGIFNEVLSTSGLARGQVETNGKLLTTLINARSNGILTNDEIKDIKEKLDDTSMSDTQKQTFNQELAQSIGGSGIAIIGADGREKFGTEASEILISQLAIVEEEISATESDLSVVEANLSALKQKMAEIQAEQGELQATLDQAKSNLDTETTQTAEITADAAGATAGMLNYDSVFDYMTSNYSHMGIGNGESLSDLATQEDRMLKDDGGNLVYIDPNTQEMYTLQKDVNGNVARDTGGEQIKVPVSPENTADLYRDMFENKLLPRNLVPDGDGVSLGFTTVGEIDGAIPEYSEHDGFTGSITKTMIPNYGTKEEFQQIIANSVVAQQAQEDSAKLAYAGAQNKIDGTKIGVADAQAALDEKNTEYADIASTIAALKQKKQDIIAQGSKADGGGDKWNSTEGMALRTSEEYQTAIANVYTGVEGHSITREELDQKLGADVSPEIKQQIEAALERDGVKIQDPDNPDNTNSNTDLVVNTDFDIGDFQLSSSNMYFTSFPFLGIEALKFEPIQLDTFQPDPNGIYLGSTYKSFADSMAFASTNPVGGSDPTYLNPINNRTDNVPTAGKTFNLAITNQSDTTENQGGITPDEALRLQRDEELLIATGISNQGGGIT